LTRSAGSAPAERTSTAPWDRWVKKAAAMGPGEVPPVNGDEAVATRSFLVRA
jgi:hypothetical protein